MAQLKQKVVSGFIWSAGEKFGSLALKMGTGLVLWAYLTPTDYTPVIILSIILGVSNLLTDSGFGVALVQHKNTTRTDYTSVFYLNMALAILFFIISMSMLGVIVRFYPMPEIYDLAPWIFIQGVIMALGLIQRTKLMREMRFALLSKIYLGANIVSTAISIYMVVTGWGIWSFVMQGLSYCSVQTLLLWVTNRWRPRGKFSVDSIKKLFTYGSNMLYTGLVTHLANSLPRLVIPKVGSEAQLGLYDKTLSLKDDISNAIILSIANVTFPAFSSLQSEDEKLKVASRKVIAVISLLLFPVMGGLIVTSNDFFHLLLKESWWPGVPYFRLFCVSAFFVPLSYLTLNIIKAKGASGMVLRLEVIKKAFLVAMVACTAPVGVEAMVYGYVAWVAFEMVVNVVASKRILKYPFAEIIQDSLPCLGVTLVMMVCVAGIGFLFPGMPLWLSLVVKVVTGIAVYAGINLLLRLPAYKDAVEIVQSLIRKKK